MQTVFESVTPQASTEVTEGVWGAALVSRQAHLPERQPGDPYSGPPRILVIDDESINVDIVEAYLEDAGYNEITTMTDSVAALVELGQRDFDVVFLDLMMPRISGLDILRQTRSHQRCRQTPFIVLTASIDRCLRRRALDEGATDFLSKPFDPEELLARTRNALLRKEQYDKIQRYAADLAEQVEKRTSELISSQLQLVHCLGRAAEYRDNETGFHVVRVGRYSALLAEGLGFDPVTVRQIELAATLHDVGKIGVPDSILLKPGRLDDEEMDFMRRHVLLGQEILSPQTYHLTSSGTNADDISEKLLHSFDSPLLRIASRIAGSHHEKWDGSGYPLGLSGEAIPLEGRIVAVADVYDALSSDRPYKAAFEEAKCLSIMHEGRGKHFDPRVLDVFFSRFDEIREIQVRFADAGEAS